MAKHDDHLVVAVNLMKEANAWLDEERGRLIGEIERLRAEVERLKEDLSAVHSGQVWCDGSYWEVKIIRNGEFIGLSCETLEEALEHARDMRIATEYAPSYPVHQEEG